MNADASQIADATRIYLSLLALPKLGPTVPRARLQMPEAVDSNQGSLP